MTGWIVIPNWGEFQHYKDRDPPWIKLYTALNSNDDWCGLSLSARGLLVTLWVEYGRSRGVLNVKNVPQVCRQKVLKKTLESLVNAGFVEVSASKPLALARSRETETETETETPLPPFDIPEHELPPLLSREAELRETAAAAPGRS